LGRGVFAEPGYSAVYTVPLNQEPYFIKKVNEWVRQGWLPPDGFREIRIRDGMGLDIELDEASKIDRAPKCQTIH
jgi:hypothetical protein